VRPVRLLQLRNLLLRKRDLRGSEGVVDVLELRGADDGCGHTRPGKHPREGDLRGRKITLGGKRHDALDDVEVLVSPV
jgi:hypothetical protein